MKRKVFSSLTDPVADMLRKGMSAGRCKYKLPGRNSLASDLGPRH